MITVVVVMNCFDSDYDNEIDDDGDSDKDSTDDDDNGDDYCQNIFLHTYKHNKAYHCRRKYKIQLTLSKIFRHIDVRKGKENIKIKQKQKKQNKTNKHKKETKQEKQTKQKAQK